MAQNMEPQIAPCYMKTKIKICVPPAADFFCHTRASFCYSRDATPSLQPPRASVERVVSFELFGRRGTSNVLPSSWQRVSTWGLHDQPGSSLKINRSHWGSLQRDETRNPFSFVLRHGSHHGREGPLCRVSPKRVPTDKL